MKIAFKIFIIFNYSLGTILLPMGDFSTLQDIPKMHQSCKEHEHRDMTPLDFITDHLINIDAIFDKHDNGDEQKQHKSFHFNHRTTITLFFQEINTFEFKPNTFKKENIFEVLFYKKSIYSFNNIHSIFRPPIVV